MGASSELGLISSPPRQVNRGLSTEFGPHLNKPPARIRLLGLGRLLQARCALLIGIDPFIHGLELFGRTLFGLYNLVGRRLGDFDFLFVAVDVPQLHFA